MTACVLFAISSIGLLLIAISYRYSMVYYRKSWRTAHEANRVLLNANNDLLRRDCTEIIANKRLIYANERACALLDKIALDYKRGEPYSFRNFARLARASGLLHLARLSSSALPPIEQDDPP